MRQAVIFQSPWGWMGIAESSKGIHTIVLPKHSKRAVEAELNTHSHEPEQEGESPRLAAARRQLLDYLAGRRNMFDVPLDLSSGTSFQRQVWRT
jgi:O6-methylguanine-DNA--protein-cysteine methyltransferase